MTDFNFDPNTMTRAYAQRKALTEEENVRPKARPKGIASKPDDGNTDTSSDEPNFYDKMLDQLLGYFSNEDEADKWAEINALEDKSRQGVAKSLVTFKKANAKRGRVAIVTQGADPVIVARQVGDEVVLEEYPIEPIAAEQLVDTNGAGDSFVGGFLSQLAQGKDLATCVKAGIYLSREVVQQSGCKMPAQMTFA